MPAVGKSGAGMISISSSMPISGLASSARPAFDHLDQVVRRNVGRHADRDAGRTVDQQVGDARRQHRRLHFLAVVVRHEIDGFLVDVGQQLVRDLRSMPALGVAHSRGGVAVDRTEVALAVDQRVAHGKVLRHAHERVVDRGIAVRVILAQHVADDARAISCKAGSSTLFDSCIANSTRRCTGFRPSRTSGSARPTITLMA